MSGNGRFGGHFVLGHVDDKGVITQVKETPNSRIVSIRASSTIINQMVKQGSITVDGVSLTIFDLRHDSFDIHLILKQDVQRFYLLNKMATKFI